MDHLRSRMSRYIVGLSIVGSIVVLLAYLWITAGADLSGRESAAWTVVLFALQVVLGVVLGREISRRDARAQYRPFVGSAIRRTFGLRRGLERAQTGLVDSWKRSSSIPDHDVTSRLLLWQEQLNGIYSQLTELIVQADTSLDDWKDVGLAEDEYKEMLAIENQREERISVMVKRIEELQELTSDPASGGATSGPQLALSELRDLAQDLEHQVETLKMRQNGRSPFARNTTRSLLTQGLTEDAVARYSELITSHPESSGHYVGRAQALYQSGDVAAALADLETARVLAPQTAASLDNLRDLMLSGSWSATDKSIEPVTELFAAVARGDVPKARSLMVTIEADVPLNPAYLAMDQCLVAIVSGAWDDFTRVVTDLDRSATGDFMPLNAKAVRIIGDLQRGAEPDWRPLKSALQRQPTYSYEKSPLVHLEHGLRSLKAIRPGTEVAFGALRNGYVHEDLLPDRKRTRTRKD